MGEIYKIFHPREDRARGDSLAVSDPVVDAIKNNHPRLQIEVDEDVPRMRTSIFGSVGQGLTRLNFLYVILCRMRSRKRLGERHSRNPTAARVIDSGFSADSWALLNFFEIKLTLKTTLLVYTLGRALW